MKYISSHFSVDFSLQWSVCEIFLLPKSRNEFYFRYAKNERGWRNIKILLKCRVCLKSSEDFFYHFSSLFSSSSSFCSFTFHLLSLTKENFEGRKMRVKSFSKWKWVMMWDFTIFYNERKCSNLYWFNELFKFCLFFIV